MTIGHEKYHTILAEYFRSKADPDNDNSWTCTHRRPLEQLTYHLNLSHQSKDLCNILSDLAYLDARIISSGPMSLLNEYKSELISSSSILKTWNAFLLSHASTLRLVPSLLPSLIWYEGPSNIRKSAEDYIKRNKYRHPWLKLDSLSQLNLPKQKYEDLDLKAPEFEIHTCCDEIITNVATISPSHKIGFFQKRIGIIGIIDFELGVICDHEIIHSSRGRLLAMSTSEDCRWLSLVDESGKIICLELAWMKEVKLCPRVISEKLFSCLLPEIESPKILFTNNCLWWQNDAGQLSSWKVGTNNSYQVVNLKGELKGIWEIENHIVVLDSTVGQTTLIVINPKNELKLYSIAQDHVLMICRFQKRKLLVLINDGSTRIFSGLTGDFIGNGPTFSTVIISLNEIGEGILFELSDYKSLFWSGNTSEPLVQLPTLKYGSGNIVAQAMIEDNLYIIKRASAIYAKQLYSNNSSIQNHEMGRIVAVCPSEYDQNYFALVNMNDKLYALGSGTQPAHLLGQASNIIEAVVNCGELVWPEVMSRGKIVLWHPPKTPEVIKLNGIGAIIYIVAGMRGEYWLTNEENEIWWMNSSGLGYKITSIENIQQPTPRGLIACDEWLIWWGISMGNADQFPTDHLDTVVFFKIVGGNENRKLQFFGHHFFAPENGKWNHALWDSNEKNLVCFFQHLGNKKFFIRVGSPEEILLGQEHISDLDLPEMLMRDQETSTPFAMGRGWLVITNGGWLVALESGTYKMLGAYPIGVLGSIASQSSNSGDCLVVVGSSAIVSCALLE